MLIKINVMEWNLIHSVKQSSLFVESLHVNDFSSSVIRHQDKCDLQKSVFWTFSSRGLGSIVVEPSPDMADRTRS